ncbi:MAG: DEAD/DEAH box helicase [Bacteroidaceae bacterium]|nr:DEAD/DEAH box helicase [Bacteroidaceae bacterium]
MKFTPYEYQRTAIQWIIDKPRCGLFLDMGLGKTVSTLTALQQLIDDCEVNRALVIAPKKVAETTWSTEADKWEHLHGLRVIKVLGSEKQRNTALATAADVYVTGRDNFAWLVAKYQGRLPFDTIVIDELTSFKSSKSQRFKAMRICLPSIRRVIGLTGTPAPNGLIDLWAQIYCLDQGERLGKSVTKYRETYFTLQKWNNIVVRSTIKSSCEDIIRSKIADICLSMQAKDYLQLPSMITHIINIPLSDKTRKAYQEFEREKVLQFKAEHAEEPNNILANSAAGLMNKLSQFANGAVYDDDRLAHEIHREKIDRLVEIVEAASGASVLVFYQYKHDIPRITDALKGYRVRTYQGEQDLIDWNTGNIDVLLAHPASTAYGLNMQQGGHYIVWFGTGWNLEHYQQANARLHRQGQQHPVTVYQLIAAGTVDERASKALESKKGVQQSLLDSLNYLIKKHSTQ